MPRVQIKDLKRLVSGMRQQQTVLCGIDSDEIKSAFGLFQHNRITRRKRRGLRGECRRKCHKRAGSLDMMPIEIRGSHMTAILSGSWT